MASIEGGRPVVPASGAGDPQGTPLVGETKGDGTAGGASDAAWCREAGATMAHTSAMRSSAAELTGGGATASAVSGPSAAASWEFVCTAAAQLHEVGAH